MSIALRDIEDEDLPWIVELNNAAVPAVSPVDEESMQALLYLSDLAIAAVDDDDQVVGFLLAMSPGANYTSENFRWFEKRGTDFFYVDRIVIAADHRGHGIGQQIYDVVFEQAQSLGREEITLEININPPNPGSMAFHKRLGFIEVGQQDTKDGTVTVAMMATLV